MMRLALTTWTFFCCAMVVGGIAHALPNVYGGNLRVCDGTNGTCTNAPTIATADGEIFASGDLEADGNLDVAGTARFAGTITSTTGSLLLHRGAQVTAAGSVTLPAGNFFTVSGNTTITGFTGPTVGRKIVLLFSGTPTVSDCAAACTASVNTQLAGNFVATDNDILTLIGNGTFWIEVSRSVN